MNLKMNGLWQQRGLVEKNINDKIIQSVKGAIIINEDSQEKIRNKQKARTKKGINLYHRIAR